MRRLRTLASALALALVIPVMAAPAEAAVPDTWTKWNLGDIWVRSLDYVTPTQLVAGSEDDGVFTSTNSLGPWTDISGNLSAAAKHVRQAVGQSGQIYLASSAGLFRGTGGGSWSQLGVAAATPQTQRLDGGGVQSIVFPTGSPTSMVVATAGSGKDGVWYSSDAGVKWTRATGLTSATFYLTGNALVGMYAATATGFYRSLDSGHSWVLMSDGIPPGESAKRIAISPLDPLHLIAATVGGVYRSDNAGLTWYAANGSGDGALLANEVRAFQLVPADYWTGGVPRIVVGTDNGVWATIDGGDSWARLSPTKTLADGLPMSNESVYSLNIGFGLPGSLMAGTQGHGVFTLPLQAVAQPGSIPAPSGTAQENAVLTANNGTWSGTAPFGFAYQWKRCAQSSGADTSGASCVDITGATDKTYQVSSLDVAKYLRVGVRARDLVQAAFSSEMLSASVGPVVTPPGFEPTPPTGYPKLLDATSAPWGQTLTIDTGGSWKSNGFPTATGFAYRWYRCELDQTGCALLPDTGTTYTTVTADVNHVVRATVVGTIATTSSPERLAGISGAVYEQTPTAVAAPRTVGTAVVGTKLQSTAGAWTGNSPTFTRRWLRCNSSGLQCGVTSPVVTTPTYTVKAADLGHRIRVEITAAVVDSFQTRTHVATSAASAVVKNPPPSAAVCAALKSKVTKAQKAVTAAQKALKKAKKTKKAKKIKAAKKKLATANTTLKKAKAALKAKGC
ncbi:sialidase family protein [Nocardioides sp. URHA0020]|uniref:sialidase family protein n=1 Tax=Nocardioides sp. URHA0020 TaxID=1380392 RepID=UPI0012DBEA67|nr:DUF1090 family protein [Nocardioides sp. URHA0020]